MLNTNKVIQFLKVKLIISNLCMSNTLFNLNNKNNKNKKKHNKNKNKKNYKNHCESYIIAGNSYLQKSQTNNLKPIVKKRKRYEQLIKIDDYCIIDTINHHQDIIIKKKIFLCMEWLNKLEIHGHNWNILSPNCIELYPTMTNKDDHPWKTVKKNIAIHLNVLT